MLSFSIKMNKRAIVNPGKKRPTIGTKIAGR
jgi:hypothetical protein